MCIRDSNAPRTSQFEAPGLRKPSYAARSPHDNSRIAYSATRKMQLHFATRIAHDASRSRETYFRRAFFVARR
eukprot:1937156-Karenia_brevis.AAC.1